MKLQRTLFNLKEIVSKWFYRKEEIDDKINIINGRIDSATGLQIQIVNELPEIGEDNYLYLIPIENDSEINNYSEYVWINSKNQFELIGSSYVDLSNYYTKSEVNRIVESGLTEQILYYRLDNQGNLYASYLLGDEEVPEENLPKLILDENGDLYIDSDNSNSIFRLDTDGNLYINYNNN